MHEQLGNTEKAERAATFFEEAGTNIDTLAKRLADFATRIRNLTDGMCGPQPRDGVETDKQPVEVASSGTRHITLAVERAHQQVDRLETEIARLESSGLV